MKEVRFTTDWSRESLDRFIPGACGYHSPIDVIINKISSSMDMQLEEGIIKTVQNVGINVDIEELIKALNYDREQYRIGYQNGFSDAQETTWISCNERLPSRNGYYVVTMNGMCKKYFDIVAFFATSKKWAHGGVIAWLDITPYEPYEDEEGEE